MTVAETGEFGLIAQIVARLGTGPTCLLGPGDDAAIVTASDGRVVATTDVLVEGRHFRRDWSSAIDIGRRAAAANLADIAAMGAVPTALLVALCTPGDLDVEWVLELADGLAAEAAITGACVVGGDISASSTLTIAVTALGDLRGGSPVLRSTARPGDIVAVAGRLGLAAAGLALLSRGLRTPRVLVEAYQRPVVRYAAGPDAARMGATSMIDVSDGLLADLGHVAAASGVVIDLVRARLAMPPELTDVASALNVDPYTWVLAGGDDHALAATFPPGAVLTEEWSVIGAVRHADAGDGVRVGASDRTGASDRAGGTVLVDGEAYHSGLTGWDHFRLTPDAS